MPSSRCRTTWSGSRAADVKLTNGILGNLPFRIDRAAQITLLLIVTLLQCTSMFAAESSATDTKETRFQALQQQALNGEAEAQAELAWLYLHGDSGLPRDERQAATWLLRAAEQGLVTAQYSLSWFYRDGTGVAKDPREAFAWLRRAAESGLDTAQYALSWAYRDGSGVARDARQADAWLHRAAEQGMADASHTLGWAYYEGRGVPQDREKAFGWFLRAARDGHTEAQGVVGAAYLTGRGVARNPVMAYRWFDLAAAAGDDRGRRGKAYLDGRLDAAELAAARHGAAQ